MSPDEIRPYDTEASYRRMHRTTVVSTMVSILPVGVILIAVQVQNWWEAAVVGLAFVDDCPLTDREIDVLGETSEGYSVADIASRVHLAEGTVRNYLSAAMQKTQTRTRHDAARYARERDWL